MTSDDDQLFGPEHVRVYRETGGERGYRWRGGEILLLNTTGSRTGETRTAPLLFRADDDRYIVVASKGGAPEHPAWWTNLQARPEATVQVRDREIRVRASAAQGEERARLWAKMVEVWPPYEDYAAKTDREIAVVVLEPR